LGWTATLSGSLPTATSAVFTGAAPATLKTETVLASGLTFTRVLLSSDRAIVLDWRGPWEGWARAAGPATVTRHPTTASAPRAAPPHVPGLLLMTSFLLGWGVSHTESGRTEQRTSRRRDSPNDDSSLSRLEPPAAHQRGIRR